MLLEEKKCVRTRRMMIAVEVAVASSNGCVVVIVVVVGLVGLDGRRDNGGVEGMYDVDKMDS